MTLSFWVYASFVCALIPACLFTLNIFFFREPAKIFAGDDIRVDVLIPARNEANTIGAALSSVLASNGVALQVWVYDDSSADETARVVQTRAVQDNRVHLVRGTALPEGWNGKQHACWQLAQTSESPLLLFLDADVRLEADAVARCVAQQQRTGVSLLSGFPRIVMLTWLEWLLLPLIQFVLLGLLPMFRMRQTTKPAYAAGCGQFMLVERSAYFASGGHAAIRATRHDGLKLPHLFRERGFRTDICDLTCLAHTRMYSSAAGVWNGLAKNATEGLASPSRILPITLLLVAGQIVPICIAILWVTNLSVAATGAGIARATVWTPFAVAVTCVLFVSIVAIYLPRIMACRRFKQPLGSALLHPLGVLLLLALQWYALIRQVIGKPVAWRARSYSTVTGKQIS